MAPSMNRIHLLVKAIAVQGHAGARISKDPGNELLQSQSAGSLLLFINGGFSIPWAVPVICWILEC